MTPPALILRAVALEYGVRVPDILGRDRHRTIMTARRAVAYLLRADGRSYPEIGIELCQADHTSAIHACRMMFERLKKHGETRRTVTRILIRLELLRHGQRFAAPAVPA